MTFSPHCVCLIMYLNMKDNLELYFIKHNVALQIPTT